MGIEAAEKYFVGNTKIIVSANAELVNVIGEMAGILPLRKKEKEM